ncbi:MAG: redox-regulated ATPase YchF, partial [Bacteroidota bacterium]
MALKCGIVGLPNVGKSTLFNCLSNAKAQAANFPFCTIEPNLGVITVPDARLNALVEIVNPQNTQPATVEIVDIAGLVQGASRGEGLGNKFLANIRETNAILHVVRCFDDPNIVHVHGNVDPIRDKEIIDTELQLKDMESVEKKLQKVERAAKTGDKDAKKAFEVLTEFKNTLAQGKSARQLETSPEDREHIADLYLLTDKPVLYVCNIDENDLKKGGTNAWVESVKSMAAAEGAGVMIVSAAVEADIAEMESFEDR